MRGLSVGTGLLDLWCRLRGWVIWWGKMYLEWLPGFNVSITLQPYDKLTLLVGYSACGWPLFQTAGHAKFTKRQTSAPPFQRISSMFSIWLCCWWFSESRVYLNSSFQHLSSPDGWSCQTAQTIHHLEAALSNISALPLLLLQHLFLLAPTLPLCILLSFSPPFSHICLPRSIFLLLITVFSFLYRSTLGYLFLFSP